MYDCIAFAESHQLLCELDSYPQVRLKACRNLLSYQRIQDWGIRMTGLVHDSLHLSSQLHKSRWLRESEGGKINYNNKVKGSYANAKEGSHEPSLVGLLLMSPLLSAEL